VNVSQQASGSSRGTTLDRLEANIKLAQIGKGGQAISVQLPKLSIGVRVSLPLLLP
jgi:hypothetical protein